jgi:hypothetical protein
MDLYRMYDRAGRLLYVGISFNAGERATQHAETKPWWPHVDHIRIEHLECSREDALRKERWTIWEEEPLHNVQHNHARNEFTPRGAPIKPYSAPELFWKSAEWHELKKAMHAFTTRMAATRDEKSYLHEMRRQIPNGASILDVDHLDVIGLIEAMALACRYAATCKFCGDLIVPDFVQLESGGTYVSTDDRRCTSHPIREVAVFGYCPACDTLTPRQFVDLKDAA